jgi:NADH-quinone oxidoreductase subunit L
MFAAIAAANGHAAIEHLVSHGVFKALLFLGCGVAMHTVGSSALAAMGGLRRVTPVAFWTMTLGFAALAGLVPTVGFFTKDDVLKAVEKAAYGSAGVSSATGWVLLFAALWTSVLTAAYATRLWARTFLGVRPEGPEAEHSHPTPWVMTVPLLLLAVATLALSWGKPMHLSVGVVSTLAAIGGIAFGWMLRNYDFGSGPARALSSELGLDRPISQWIPAIASVQARIVVFIDNVVVDAYPRGGGAAANGVSWLLDRLQSAKAQLYATGIAAGAVVAVIGGVIAR